MRRIIPVRGCIKACITDIDMSSLSAQRVNRSDSPEAPRGGQAGECRAGRHEQPDAPIGKGIERTESRQDGYKDTRDDGSGQQAGADTEQDRDESRGYAAAYQVARRRAQGQPDTELTSARFGQIRDEPEDAAGPKGQGDKPEAREEHRSEPLSAKVAHHQLTSGRDLDSGRSGKHL